MAVYSELSVSGDNNNVDAGKTYHHLFLVAARLSAGW